MAKLDNPYSAPFILNPVYWPMWLAFGVLRLCVFLPYSVICKIAGGLSFISKAIMPKRRRIMRTNIRLCFPDYSKKDVNKLLQESFYSSTMTLFESAISWWGKDSFFEKNAYFEGMKHIEKAQQKGNGILYLGAHYTTLEIGGRLTLPFIKKLVPTYKPARNKLFNAMMLKSRVKNHGDLIASNNLREILKRLKKNGEIWYAPDQDFGISSSVFAPFMGVQTTTLTTTIRIAKSSGAAILPWYCERLPDHKGYKITIGSALENFPSGNDINDATTINKAIEKQIHKTPEQYFWGHRRFKTRPRGDAQVYKPRREKFMYAYTYAHVLLCVPIIIYTLYLSIKNRQRSYFRQRLGLATPPKADMLIHAASIGEVNAAAPLIQRILETNPEIKILLSSNTTSGLATARGHFKQTVSYYYMPIDWHWLAYRYLRQVNPDCVLIMETEIWPNFYEYCFYKGIPNIIVNARLSERSLKVPLIVKKWLSQSAQYITAVLARSPEDAERYKSLNADSEHVKVIGNIKYAVNPSTQLKDIEIKRPFVLFASSRDEEEKTIVGTWLSLENNNTLLVIVPRHIHRLSTILTDLASLDLDIQDISVRSRSDEITHNTRIYIADTFGELNSFIAAAKFVIIGGSFEPFGGQNIIEVGAAGKAVIFGPYMDNFKFEAKQFIETNSAIQVNDQAELKIYINHFLTQPDMTLQVGQNGLKLIAQHQDIIDQYEKEIRHYCKTLN